MIPIDPFTLHWFAEQRHQELVKEAERHRMIALARAGRERRSPLQGTRRLTGAVLIRVGEWVQGVRRVEHPAPVALESPTPAA